MYLDDLLNQELMAGSVGRVAMKSYYGTVAELLERCKATNIAIGVPTQEHADILNGYVLVQGKNNVRVVVDTTTPHIYRLV